MNEITGTSQPVLPVGISRVGRQPILDRHLNIYGYELLYRSDEAFCETGFDGDLATARTVLDSFLEFGLHRLVGPHQVFINMTRAFFTELQPLPIDKSRLVIEVLEDIEPTADVINGVSRLHAEGYTIALDDFRFEPRWNPLLPHCSIVKVDILHLDIDAYQKQIHELKSMGLTLLAEKVETREDFDRVKMLGFDLFQGYFFAKPQIVTTSRLSSNKNIVLQMIAKINDQNADIDEIASLIELDANLSFKVLRFINSAAISFPKKVTSIHQAVIYVGMHRLRAWSTLFIMAGMDNFSPELITTSLVRAEVCKSHVTELKLGDPESAYTVGLLSTLDAMLPLSMQELVIELPLPEQMIEALKERSGPYAMSLQCAIDLEECQWLTEAAQSMSVERLNSLYVKALERVEMIRGEFA
ncbi:MAG: HDOD domain-containing protein [Candidatus Thiodiazotropha sp. (ex Lucina aurantia)]|uniref:HDOD domain protein n=2 Tax=Candidatus Thiodiazotropha TaxID=1913444 RepID=A0A7Z0VK39_9GAMM|nr:HDOD domain-containing protein [Candidatus Thiodiazotropha endolucinida]MBT3011872.1 HDOD domain-containing protein [Candidatus Thiodiazotropha sp. (ex Lucina pensylvanica)]MBT3023714.1 HDOD domain-containing protein [Candidatus Thiodiazotropha taylori]MBT3039488.1 HDOD domain-containing protein [Candidatus Thiodiazotropha sp. (ex Codakia orbicularis)]MBV2103489.1 HDOD domain-containing protein [Candidatus Thiodiazotropha sp. (ex Lucina aurantia)]MBT3031010.1 HDOD domain-containing protein 